ncbi:S41 family peptidase [Luteimonas aquatica]|uniref:S41 family peptidase n=1 Tax=Luteimonas aquatica TaxID=450364 RepID=UPI001F586008|nr:S41 family peptidase [Luteimonas aquatica]
MRRPLSILVLALALGPALAQEAPVDADRPAQTQSPQPQPPQPQPPQPQPSQPQPPQPQPQPSPAQEDPASPDDAALAGDNPDAAESAASKVPLDEIRRYVGVYNAVKQAYVDPVDDKKLMSSAIRGLLLDLDPHSAYLEKRDAKEFDEDTSGAYDGIGVEVQQQPDGTVRVIAPIDDTPAARAGIKAGDLITAVDGKALTPTSDEDGQGPLRGAPGTSVKLTIAREGVAKPVEITVKRETIRVVSVRSRMLEPGYAYVRVSAFQADTAAEFERQLRKLQEAAGGAAAPRRGLRGLVLDLRSNPGGLLTSAVQIADDLLERGKIVSTRGRIPISDAEFAAVPGDLMNGAPVVVIVDAGSASAAEVLAGALHDNKRARVIGSRTFGKGSVQTLLPLDNGDSVKLTTARYYTPSGKSIQARGIDPDVVLKPDKADAKPVDYSESMLPGHLRGDEEIAGSNAGAVLEGDGPITAALAELKNPSATAKATPAAPPARK